MDEKSALLVTTRKNAKRLSLKLKENGCTYIRLIRGRHRSLKLLNEYRICNVCRHSTDPIEQPEMCCLK